MSIQHSNIDNLDLLEEYDLASRNPKTHKFLVNHHMKHYDESNLALNDGLKLEIKEDVIHLPKPLPLPQNSTDLFSMRSSQRDFSGEKISIEELSTLLHYSNGMRDVKNLKKYAPSSGGLCSIEVYVILLNVDGIENGIYYFNSYHNILQVKVVGDFRAWLREDVFFQEEYSFASVAFILTSNIDKLKHKYGIRGYRLGLLDTGHVSQNIYLLSTALNLKVCATAGFIDDEIITALNISGLGLIPFLILLVGK